MATQKNYHEEREECEECEIFLFLWCRLLACNLTRAGWKPAPQLTAYYYKGVGL